MMPCSSSHRVQHLLQQRHELAAVEQAAKTARRAAQKKEWKRCSRVGKRWERMMSVGILVLALVAQPDLRWVSKLIERFELSADAEQVEEELAARFLASSDETLAMMLAPSSQPALQLLKAAREFAADVVLVSWVCSQNLDKGVTPTVGDLIQQRAHELSAMPGADSEARPTSFELSAEYKWSKAFRNRWSMRQGTAAEREQVPLDAMRHKA